MDKNIRDNSFILKGNICHSLDKNTIEVTNNGYLVCLNGKSEGVYEKLIEKYQGLPIKEYGDALIIPGLVDLHTHAPQYAFRGLGMGMQLLEWLNTHTFPEEAKYKDLRYSKTAYEIFADDLKKSATTRACIFGTIHILATELLMDLLETTGLKTMVGKVNMDRNTPDYLKEDTGQSAKDTIRWLTEIEGVYENVKPILTPRFIPSCSDELMRELKKIQENYKLPIQSHLSENMEEVKWVKELCPDSVCYGDAYHQFGLFGGEYPAVMAHCVYSDQEEIRLIKQQGVYVAHCPGSNTNLTSGIAPIRKYLDEGLCIGLGSDMAGGFTGSIFRAMTDSIQVSKLRYRLVDQSLKPLTAEEAFFMGTRGGGAFFGNVGCFEKGYELDAVIIDDSRLKHPQELTVKERLERCIYLAENEYIIGKYVAGKQII